MTDVVSILKRWRLRRPPFSPAGAALTRLAGARPGPPNHVLTFCEMQQRLHVGQLDTGAVRHRVGVELRFGRLQRPLRVMDFEPAWLPLTVDRVQAVALGQKIFERTGRRAKYRTDRTIRCDEACGRRLGFG